MKEKIIITNWQIELRGDVPLETWRSVSFDQAKLRRLARTFCLASGGDSLGVNLAGEVPHSMKEISVVFYFLVLFYFSFFVFFSFCSALAWLRC